MPSLATIRCLVSEYESYGHCAAIYPRKRRVSLSGFRAVPFPEAATKMRETIAAAKSLIRIETIDYKGSSATWCEASLSEARTYLAKVQGTEDHWAREESRAPVTVYVKARAYNDKIRVASIQAGTDSEEKGFIETLI